MYDFWTMPSCPSRESEKPLSEAPLTKKRDRPEGSSNFFELHQSLKNIPDVLQASSNYTSRSSSQILRWAAPKNLQELGESVVVFPVVDHAEETILRRLTWTTASAWCKGKNRKDFEVYAFRKGEASSSWARYTLPWRPNLRWDAWKFLLDIHAEELKWQIRICVLIRVLNKNNLCHRRGNLEML